VKQILGFGAIHSFDITMLWITWKSPHFAVDNVEKLMQNPVSNVDNRQKRGVCRIFATQGFQIVLLSSGKSSGTISTTGGW